MDYNKFFQAKTFKITLLTIGTLIVLLVVFQVGMMVGLRKASFSYRWAENYHQNFAGPRGGFLGDWQRMPPPPGDFIESHGTFGEIIKINNSDFVIKGQNDVEKIIIVNNGTIIEKGRQALKKEDLKVSDKVVVVGTPNDQGQIEAKLIRVF